MGGVRPLPGYTRRVIRIAQQLSGIVAHHLYAASQRPEHFIGQPGFQVGDTVHVFHNHRVDDFFGGSGHGGKLPFIGLSGQRYKHIVLGQHGRQKDPRHQEYRDQNQVYDFVLNTADHQVPKLPQYISPQ